MEVVQYKCPNCSANLAFQAATQDFGCAHCDSAFSSEQLAEIYPQNEGHALDIQCDIPAPKTAEELAEEQAFADCTALYSCPNCGASVVTDDTTSATHCVYCLSPIILTGRLSGDYKPSKLIPFKVTEEQAKAKFAQYCKKRWFLPKSFRSGAHLHEMKAIYVPYWISDCTTSGAITAKCKKVRSWISGDYQFTETREFIAVRNGYMHFMGIPSDASSRADSVLMECIEPFNYSEVTDFKMSFLSGYMAEKYDVTKEQVYPRVRERAVTASTDVMRSSIVGYNSVNIVNNTLDIYHNNWSHFLLPVWFLTYKHTHKGKEKFYHFAVNGQTGKFMGDLPIVWAKVALAAGITALVANGIVLGIMWGGGYL
jgi:DNA-directed RNA polymerase subunit RPC12/RpoP